MRCDLVDMQLFLHVVEAGSITKGADKAHLALASASVRIRDMEADLGEPLLVRKRQGVEMTAAGRTFAHHARIVLQQMERMRGELGENARGIKGRIRLLCNTSALIEHLPAALNAFMSAHPHVVIDLEERLSYDIVQALANGLCDVGIVADTVDLRGLESFPFRPDRLVLVVPKAHPISERAGQGKKRKPSFSDALDLDFIGLAGDSALQQYLAAQASRIGKRIRYRVLLRSFEAICQMVENQVGVAIVPESAARRCAKSMAIDRHFLEEPWTSRHLLICVREFDALSKHAMQLVTDIRA